MVWVQGGGHPAAEAPSPPSPVFGAFDDRNLARSGALSYGPPALGGGQAPPKDTLRTLAPGRLPTPSHPMPDEDFCKSFPGDPVVVALRMLIEVHLPLVFLTIATIRLLGSPVVEDRKRAMRILHDELMPQLSVNFKVLGSPEYSKITLEYYTHLTFFKQFRPDLYAAMEINGTRLIDEVNIELVHAF